jgi:mannose/fructose/N-acetylgalactosamine-specific phosphotransferase system component IID
LSDQGNLCEFGKFIEMLKRGKEFFNNKIKLMSFVLGFDDPLPDEN